METVDFWQNLIQSFNETNKCDFCWSFYAPLTEVDLNLVQSETECCVNVFLVWDKGLDFDVQPSYDQNKGIYVNPSERDFYDVYFLIKSKTGLNNYNEKAGHPIEESRYKTIFEPLRKCIKFDIIEDLCLNFGFTTFSGKNIYDYQDEQYYGIRISVTTQKRL